MRAKNRNHPGKSTHRPIVYLDGFPVQVIWSRSQSTPDQLLLGYHRELEFHYIKQGEGSYLIGNQSYAFRKNSLLIIRANETHCLIPKPESYIEKGTLIFGAALVKDKHWLTLFPRKFPHQIHLPEREATMIEIILNEISKEEQKKERYWQEIISLKLKEFLFLVKRVSVQNPSFHRTNPQVSRILTHIEKNFAQPLSRESIAGEFALSPNYLSGLFKKYTGINLKHYILQRRIAEAKKILTEQPTLKVGLLPKKVGFSDFALFNRSFKLITGLTPTTYRTISHRDNR